VILLNLPFIHGSFGAEKFQKVIKIVGHTEVLFGL
jgi:hypothetical protein